MLRSACQLSPPSVDVAPPAFVSDGASLRLVAADGAAHPVDVYRPYRRVVSADGRVRLVTMRRVPVASW